MLKNFSSLKAIISALNSNSIYRLSKIWEVLPKERVSFGYLPINNILNTNLFYFFLNRWKSLRSWRIFAQRTTMRGP